MDMAMPPSVSRVQQFVLRALVPIICSIVLGFIIFQGGVFHRTHGSFQFVWSAVVASVFYHLLVLLRPRDAYLGLILLLMLTFVAARSTRPGYILRDIFYIGEIGAAVLIYFRYFKQGADLNVGTPPLRWRGSMESCSSSVRKFISGSCKLLEWRLQEAVSLM